MKNYFPLSSARVKKAFSLIEVIVAISVLVMVIMSSTDLLVSITRSNNVNVHTLVAYELAQEGLEGIRNIRDSNWLLNADFSGKISSLQGNVIPWGSDSFPSQIGETDYYTLDYHTLMQASPLDTVELVQLNNFAPWKLTLLSSSSGSSPQTDPAAGGLYIRKSGLNQDLIQYVHGGSSGDEESMYRRIIKMEAFGYPSKSDQKVYKYRVTSMVFWTEDHQDKNVQLTEELTDWKGGPL